MFERYYHELLQLISHSIGCRDKARDVVQEAYARVLSRKPGQPPIAADDGQRALLYVTAKNIVIDQYRQNRLRRHENIEHYELPAPQTDEPERRAAGKQSMERLIAGIEGLPPRCRLAFTLYKFEGLSHREIAARMEISVNMVEKHIINGMVACKKTLDEQGEG